MNKFENISEKLNPNELQKNKIFNNISPVKSSKKRLRLTPITICIAILLSAISVGAATVLDIDFLNFLNPHNDEQAKLLANGAYLIDEYIEQDSGTVHVKQIIGDSNMSYILFDFIAPEGVTLDGYQYFPEDMYFNSDHSSHMYSGEMLPDENPNDNIASFIFTVISDDGGFEGHDIKLSFSNFYAYETMEEFEDDVTTPTLIAKGTWTCEFEANFKSYSEHINIDKDIEMFGYEATVDTISISPISATVVIKSDYVDEISTARRESVKDLPLTFHYADGTTELLDSFNGLISASASKKEIVTVKEFESVINEKEIISVEFFDVVIYERELTN